MAKKDVSVYLSFLLRHKPEDIGLEMDRHGWASVDELIAGINRKGKYTLDFAQLEEIVRQDNKGRYRFNADRSKSKHVRGIRFRGLNRKWRILRLRNTYITEQPLLRLRRL